MNPETQGQEPFFRWLLSKVLTTEFFKNTITLMLVGVYCTLMIMGRTPESQFGILIGMILGNYFKKGPA